MRTRLSVFLLTGAVMLTACEQSTSPNDRPKQNPPPSLARISSSRPGALLATVNRKLARLKRNYRIQQMEYITAGRSGQIGQIIIANDRGNKQFPIRFIPDDPRRFGGGGVNITYLTDQADGAANGPVTAAQTEAAIDRAMNTWEVTTKCSKFSIDKVPFPGEDPDVFDGFFGLGFGTPFADITHAGWYPGAFFDAVFGPGGSAGVIAFTQFFIFINPDGSPTDIDGDGNLDAAFAEIYYNDAFEWAIDAGNDPDLIDVETVALHESGHGLEQAHFGKVFITESNGRLHFAPRAVMNAVYFGELQSLLGTDRAGHCSLWASWPH